MPEPIGVIGIFLDAGLPPNGFVDTSWLPLDGADWPRVGDESEFEVLQHRHGQMRLWPINPAWRRDDLPPWIGDQDWDAVTAALRVGDVTQGRVTGVYPANRECSVDLGIVTAVAEWSGDAPVVGDERRVIVKAILDTTRRVLINFL